MRFSSTISIRVTRNRRRASLQRCSNCDAGGGYRALAELRDRGEIKAIGAGVNHVGMIPRFLERFEIDFFLVAMPYTLLEQEALDGELQLCEARGVSVVIGAPFASGILARGPTPGALYRYAPAEPDILAEGAADCCCLRKHDVPLAAAALQFPFGHPSVVSIIPGPVTTEEVRMNLAWMRRSIPGGLWAESETRRPHSAGCAGAANALSAAL